jgi:penicillin G amidase
MGKAAKIFWVLLLLFLYKLTFLENEQPDTHFKFSIARDENGIPHIYGRKYEDILFGLGYAEAQDRLWTLYFKKMLVQGRTAEMFGPDMAANDIELRNIGYHDIGKKSIEHTDAQTLKLLHAYADGINAYARSVKMLPFEFYLFWLPWEDWTVEDSIGSLSWMSFCLEFDWFYEIARQRLLETVGFDLTTKLIHFGNTLFRNTTIVKDDELKEKGLFEQYDLKKQREILKEHWLNKNMTLGSIQLPHITGAVEGTGSNAWIIGGEHTANGRPILANDPHVVSLIPNFFYHFEIVRLSEDNQIISRKFGVMADGIPSLSIGVTNIAAWGSTAAYIDNKDVYYETIRNNSGTLQYKFKDEWHDFKTRREVIKVRGAEPIVETYYHTHRGVVIESVFMDMHWKYGYPLPQHYRDNHTLSLVAVHHRPDNSTIKGMLNLIVFEDY